MRSSLKRSIGSKRVISAAVLLFVFFLPLHFHLNGSAKVAQECACVQGTRSQLAPISLFPDFVPVFITQTLVLVSSVPRPIEWLGPQSVRAPPISLSV
jgi:hypothetical protein